MSQVSRVCEFLKKNPGKVFLTRELAVSVYSENPGIYTQKLVKLSITNPRKNIITQIAAEINSQILDIKKRDSNIVTDETEDRVWVYKERVKNPFNGKVIEAPVVSRGLPEEVTEALSSLVGSVNLLSSTENIEDKDFEDESLNVWWRSLLIRRHVPGLIDDLTKILQYVTEVENVSE